MFIAGFALFFGRPNFLTPLVASPPPTPLNSLLVSAATDLLFFLKVAGFVDP